MIRYDLICGNGHAFRAWFSSSDAFERQQAAALVSCPVCGDTRVERQITTPAIPAKGNRKEDDPAHARVSSSDSGDDAARHARLMRQFVREIHAMVRERAEYVGTQFAEEARRRHADGTAQQRPIWGKATAEDARELREEGIDVVPLPPLPDEGN